MTILIINLGIACSEITYQRLIGTEILVDYQVRVHKKLSYIVTNMHKTQVKVAIKTLITKNGREITAFSARKQLEKR